LNREAVHARATSVLLWSGCELSHFILAARRYPGERKVREHGHPVAGTAALGGTLRLLVGGRFALPTVGIAAGAALGIHKAREKEIGIDNAFIESIGAKLTSDSSAIFLLVDGGADTTKAVDDLAKFGGAVHSADRSEDQLSRFQQCSTRTPRLLVTRQHRAYQEHVSTEAKEASCELVGWGPGVQLQDPE
jgi:uncharacterized membrane protein